MDLVNDRVSRFSARHVNNCSAGSRMFPWLSSCATRLRESSTGMQTSRGISWGYSVDIRAWWYEWDKWALLLSPTETNDITSTVIGIQYSRIDIFIHGLYMTLWYITYYRDTCGSKLRIIFLMWWKLWYTNKCHNMYKHIKYSYVPRSTDWENLRDTKR